MKNIKSYLFLALACILIQPALSAQQDADCNGVWIGDVVGPVTIVSVDEDFPFDTSPLTNTHNWGPACDLDNDVANDGLSSSQTVGGEPGWVITYTFSQPVNDIRWYWEGVVQDAIGQTEFLVTTNAPGDVSIDALLGCFEDSSDGIFVMGANPFIFPGTTTPVIGSGTFLLSNPGGDFTTLTVQSTLPNNAAPPGGYWALCDNSPGLLNAVTCAAGDDAPALNIGN